MYKKLQTFNDLEEQMAEWIGRQLGMNLEVNGTFDTALNCC